MERWCRRWRYWKIYWHVNLHRLFSKLTFRTVAIAQSLSLAHALSIGVGNVSAFRASWDRWEHIVTQYVPYVKCHARSTRYTRGVNLKGIWIRSRAMKKAAQSVDCCVTVEQLYERISSFETLLKTQSNLYVFLINDLGKKAHQTSIANRHLLQLKTFSFPKDCK